MKLLYFILFFLSSLSAQANFETDCYSNTNNLSVLDTFAIEKDWKNIKRAMKLEWWSANDKQIENRACKTKPQSITQMKESIKKLNQESMKVTQKYNSITFEDESEELINHFLDLMTKRSFLDQGDPNININKFKFDSNCKKVQCAIEKVFGEKIGTKLLYLKTHYGLNGSDFSFPNSDRLNNNEIDNLINTAQALPSSLLPLNTNKQLTKFSRGYTLKAHDSSVLAYAAISFYDAWSELSSESQQSTAFHEIAHYVGGELNIDENKQWNDLSGWVQKGDDWISENKDNFASRYGATNPAEDFAEAMTAYRYNPSILLKTSPSKYQYLKENVFDGLEYTSDKACDESNSLLKKISKDIDKIDSDNLGINISDITKSCSYYSVSSLIKPSSMNNLNSCIDNQIKAKKLRYIIDNKELKITYPEIFTRILEDFPDKLDNIEAKENKPLRDEIKKEIKAQLSNSLKKQPVFHNDSLSIEDNCKRAWGNYGYLKFLDLEKSIMSSKAINLSSEIDSFLTSKCTEIFRSNKKIAPYSDKQIDNILKNY